MSSLLVWILFYFLILSKVIASPFLPEHLHAGRVEQVSSSPVQLANLGISRSVQQPDKCTIKLFSDNQDSLDSSFQTDTTGNFDSNDLENLHLNTPGTGNPSLKNSGKQPSKAPTVAFFDFFQKQPDHIPGPEPIDPCLDDDSMKSLCCDPNTIEYDGEGYIRKVHRCTACRHFLGLVLMETAVHMGSTL